MATAAALERLGDEIRIGGIEKQSARKDGLGQSISFPAPCREEQSCASGRRHVLLSYNSSLARLARGGCPIAEALVMLARHWCVGRTTPPSSHTRDAPQLGVTRVRVKSFDVGPAEKPWAERVEFRHRSEGEIHCFIDSAERQG